MKILETKAGRYIDKRIFLDFFTRVADLNTSKNQNSNIQINIFASE